MTTPDPHPWCCARSLGFASECPLCPQYGTNAIERCPGHGLNDANQAVIETARLHAEHRHPGYEYRITEGSRKQWEDIARPPAGEDGEPDPSWERNVDAGRAGQGWDRFDYTEESYWRRKKAAPEPLDGPESVPQASGGELAGRSGDRSPQAASSDALRERLAVEVHGESKPASPELAEQLRTAIESEMYEYRERTMFWPEGAVTTLIAELATRGALEALGQYLEFAPEDAWCKICRRVWDGKRHRCESRAEQRLAQIRDHCTDLRSHGYNSVSAERLLDIIDGRRDKALDPAATQATQPQEQP